MDTKNTIETALGTLTTVAFAIPVAGPGIAAGLAVADFFVKVFFPDSTPPPPPPATEAELKQELKDLLSKLVDSGWNDTTDNITNKLFSLTSGVQNTWKGMTALGVNGKDFSMDTADPNVQNFITATNIYFMLELTTSVKTKLIDYQGHLTNASSNDALMDPLTRAEHRTAHTAVLCLVNGLMVAYLKMAVAWGWGLEMLLNAQYQAYQAALDEWNGRDAAYQAKHPYATLVQNLDKQYPDLKFAVYTTKDWNGYLLLPDCPAGVLKQQVDAMVKYCVRDTDALYTTMRKNWDDLDTLIASYNVVPATASGVTQAELSLAVANGMKRATDWKATLEKDALVGVSEDDIDRFGQNIVKWRAAAASVSFSVYTVKTGDTLTSIAAGSPYKDASLATKIYDTNRDVLSDPNTLAVGTVLKIFDKDALPYLIADATPFDPSQVGV